MSEAVTKSEPSVKSKSAKETAVGRARFQFPQLEVPKLEVPGGFREMADQWVSQGKANFERALVAAEEMNSACGKTCTTATKCTADYAAKVGEIIHKNTAATFDLVHDVMAAKSLPEMIEVSMADARKQFDAFAAQSQELWSLAQKGVVETTKPITTDWPKAFQPPMPS